MSVPELKPGTAYIVFDRQPYIVRCFREWLRQTLGYRIKRDGTVLRRPRRGYALHVIADSVPWYVRLLAPLLKEII